MPLVDVADGAISYRVAGAGETVVFVSGLGGTAAFWDNQVDRFSGMFRVVTYDHRGVGSSKGLPPYSVAQWADDLLAVIEAVGADRVHLVGHSTGGIVAQLLAAERPERVRTLALGGTWIAPDQRFLDLFALRKDILVQLGGSAYRMLGDLLASSDPRNAQQVSQYASMPQADRDVVIGRIDALLAYDGKQIVPRIKAPAIVFASSDDYIVPIYLSETVANSLPGAVMVRFDHGGHFFPRTRADAYNQALLDFWKRTE